MAPDSHAVAVNALTSVPLPIEAEARESAALGVAGQLAGGARSYFRDPRDEALPGRRLSARQNEYDGAGERRV